MGDGGAGMATTSVGLFLESGLGIKGGWIAEWRRAGEEEVGPRAGHGRLTPRMVLPSLRGETSW